MRVTTDRLKSRAEQLKREGVRIRTSSDLKTAPESGVSDTEQHNSNLSPDNENGEKKDGRIPIRS
jgi:hypothetical protein